ncbi:hypothetical protein QT349_24730 (plasmid) [Escherichia coli]|nr:hypothetical protein [Escherichia coli]
MDERILMPLPPNFLSPEDQAEYDAYMSRFSEINHYYDYHTVPVIDWFFKQATEALHHELWIPACTSFLNGIENITHGYVEVALMLETNS